MASGPSQRNDMRPFILCTATLALGVIAAGAGSLEQHAIPIKPLVIDRLIIGRAKCGASTWLLTDPSVLIEVNLATSTVSTTPVSGLSANDHLWGLACVGFDQLWTVADYRTLIRFSPSGKVISRTKLREPWLNIFAAGESLLLQRPPDKAGAPLLVSVPVADLHHSRPWPGPTTMPFERNKIDAASGLVTCGISSTRSLPCWIRSKTQIIVSDGEPSHTSVVQPRFIIDRAVDPTVPIWDSAIGASSVLWVLTSAVSGVDGRRAGARLTRSDLHGEDLGSVEIEPRARLIVSATSQTATVLTTTGTLVAVGAR